VYTVGFKILSNDGNLKEIYIQGKRAKSLTADKIVGDSGNPYAFTIVPMKL